MLLELTQRTNSQTLKPSKTLKQMSQALWADKTTYQAEKLINNIHFTQFCKQGSPRSRCQRIEHLPRAVSSQTTFPLKKWQESLRNQLRAPLVGPKNLLVVFSLIPSPRQGGGVGGPGFNLAIVGVLTNFQIIEIGCVQIKLLIRQLLLSNFYFRCSKSESITLFKPIE